MTTTTAPAPPPAQKPRPSGAGAAFVAAGIFVSRVAGFVREAVFAWALGSTDAADAFKAALRIPNFLQNLFGEGVLSASFIPAYAKLLEADRNAAVRLAGVIASLLSVVSTTLVLAGVVAAPFLVDALAPGFGGQKRTETILLVRVLFPGTGLLVLSAWCLGILNSHRRLFVSYAAPVAWNAAIIVALVAAKFVPATASTAFDVAHWAAVGAVVGSALQLLVQLVFVVPLVRGLRPSLDTSMPAVRGVLARFVPVVIGRGVVQVSAFVEEVLASFLPRGSMANIAYAQTLTMLPVSLFGMAISAAALPELSREAGDTSAVAKRLHDGAQRIVFFVLPSAVAFLFLGDVVAATVFQRGAFTADSTLQVWAILAGASLGLLASTQSRLLSSVFYALEDTRTPLVAAVARVVVGTAAGALAAFYGPGVLDVDARYAAAGLSVGTSVGALVELWLLRRFVRARVTLLPLRAPWLARVVVGAALAAAAAWGAKLGLAALDESVPVLVRGVVVLGVYGVVYFAVTAALGVEHARGVFGAVKRRLPGQRRR